MEADNYYKIIESTLSQRQNPTDAAAKAAYLRHQFTFYGIRQPELRTILRRIFKTHPLREVTNLPTLILQLINAEYRELHYAALIATEKIVKKQTTDFIDTLTLLITTNSWWDTVDHAAKLVGIHFQNHPQLILPTTERWMNSNNIWLQRVCLIFQLFYRDQTDWELLQRYILAVSDSDKFFLQKAAGWALRQYSRTAPEQVVEFVQCYELPKLTRKEALRLLK